MTPTWTSLTPKAKRAQFRRTFLRSTLTAALLIVLYFVVPLTRLADLRSWLLLVGVLCIFGVVAAWQIRRIVRATYPLLRAVEGLSAALSLYLLGFAILYYLMAATTPESFSTQPVPDRVAVLHGDRLRHGRVRRHHHYVGDRSGGGDHPDGNQPGFSWVWVAGFSTPPSGADGPARGRTGQRALSGAGKHPVARPLRVAHSRGQDSDLPMSGRVSPAETTGAVRRS